MARHGMRARPLGPERLERLREAAQNEAEVPTYACSLCPAPKPLQPVHIEHLLGFARCKASCCPHPNCTLRVDIRWEVRALGRGAVQEMLEEQARAGARGDDRVRSADLASKHKGRRTKEERMATVLEGKWPHFRASAAPCHVQCPLHSQDAELSCLSACFVAGVPARCCIVLC